MKKLLKKGAIIFVAVATILGSINLPMAQKTVFAETTPDGDWDYNVKGDEVEITKYKGSETNLTIPSTIDGKKVVRIRTGAFSGCNNIVSITVPDGVTEIWKSYNWGENLTSIIIPKSVTFITSNAFGSSNNVKIYYAGSPCEANTLFDSQFRPVIFGTEKGHSFDQGTITVTKQDTYTEEGTIEYCCSDCDAKYVLSYKNDGVQASVSLYETQGTGLDIVFPDTIKGYEVISCSNRGSECNQWRASSIKLPSGITSMGGFEGCTNLTSFTIPEGVTCIGNNAFKDCRNLTEITIPSSVTSIGECAFFGCSSLKNVTIPDGVTYIQGSSFEGCSSLTKINIPEGVPGIGQYAFKDCKSLTDVTIPNSVTYILNAAFMNCSSLTSLTMPEGTTRIDVNAFAGCSSLTGVTITGDASRYAFADCSSLTSITISEGVTFIGNNAFQNCSSVTSITIPKSVKNIQQNAFVGCTALKSFTILSRTCDLSVCKVGLYYSNVTGSYNPIKDFVIYGYANSKAEEYANSWGIPFVRLLDDSVIKLTSKSATYTGKAISIGKATVEGSTGKVTYTYYTDSKCTKKTTKKANGASKDGAAPKNVGTYYVKATVAADSGYKKATSKAVKLTIKAAKPTIKVSTTTINAKASDVKSKAKGYTVKTTVTGSGKLTYAATGKNNSSCLSINKSTGKITVKKGTKAGTYKISVKVSAAKTANYTSGSKTVTIKVVVK